MEVSFFHCAGVGDGAVNDGVGGSGNSTVADGAGDGGTVVVGGDEITMARHSRARGNPEKTCPPQAAPFTVGGDGRVTPTPPSKTFAERHFDEGVGVGVGAGVADERRRRQPPAVTVVTVTTDTTTVVAVTAAA